MTTQPARYANYRGNVVEDTVGKLMGPNRLAEFVQAVEATYDEATDTTRVGFVFVPREEAFRQLAGGGGIL